MMDKITWTNERRKLSDLIPWPRNPRQIKGDQAKRLVQSFDEFGQVETIAIGPGNEVYNGHQRLNVLAQQYGKDYEVECRVSSRALEEKEREKLTVFLHKGAAGEWDFDTLANEFELDELLEWGFGKDELIDQDSVYRYTRNIKAPIYEPKGARPVISELYNDSRTKELVIEIDESDLPEDEKEFLKVAAHRHTVLNFKKIAEYYAHADKELQKFMENSALVIIDFEKAIELGYVRLSEAVAEQYIKDYGSNGN